MGFHLRFTEGLPAGLTNGNSVHVLQPKSPASAVSLQPLSLLKLSKLMEIQGPAGGPPEPGSYAEELARNVVVDATSEGPQEVPPKVPGAFDPNKPDY